MKHQYSQFLFRVLVVLVPVLVRVLVRVLIPVLVLALVVVLLAPIVRTKRQMCIVLLLHAQVRQERNLCHRRCNLLFFGTLLHGSSSRDETHSPRISRYARIAQRC